MSDWDDVLEEIGEHANIEYSTLKKKRAERPLDFPSPVSTNALVQDILKINSLVYSL